MTKLFDEIKIGNLTLKNRVIMAPMENGMAAVGNGKVTSRIISFFEKRAENHVAMIMPGSIGVAPEGRGLPTQLSMYDASHVDGHKRLVDAIHAKGSLVGAQIYHAGRQASEAITGLTPLAPSAMPCSILNNHPAEITTEQMDIIKNQFVKSAAWCVQAGYDLVEVHFAHGYLLHSFMSTHSNHRSDEYGGSFENRIKYPMDVLKAVIREVGDKVPVQIRVSVDEYVEDGMKFDEVKKVCKLAVEAGVASISLSAGCYDAVDYAIQPMYIPQGFIVPFAEELRKEIDVPVIVAARLNNASLIKDIVDTNKADIVAVGRGLIADPEIITKIKNHDEENIRYCVACNQGCIDRVLGGMHAHCLVNAVAGEEESRALKPKDKDLTVAVVGAGPAGMQAALTASQRGFQVNLYAKDGLNGKLTTLAAPPEKESFLLFKDYLCKQIAKTDIQVINKEVVTCEDVEGDVVILATGSKQLTPPIPGIDLPYVVYAEDVLNGTAAVGKSAVVIGAGLVGTETCKFLGEKGIELTLVEMKDSIADGIGATFIGHMFAKLAQYHVNVLTSAAVKEITASSVLIDDTEVACETVVIAAGYRPVNDLETVLKEKFEVHVIGDAKAPRRILEAVEDAYVTVNNL